MRPLVPALLLAAACNTGFDPQYRVLDLRILAVRSQVEGSAAADASPQDTLRLEALVANPRGRAPLEVRWFACAPPEPGTLSACRDPDLLRDPASLAGSPGVLELGRGEQVTIPLPDLAAQPGVGAALDAALAVAIAEARRVPSYQCSLFLEIPVVAVAEAGSERDVALKRVRIVPPPGALPPDVTSHYLPNLNPAVGTVVRDPVDADVCTGGTALSPDPFPGARTLLCGRPASGGAGGPYNECNERGEATREVTESLSWQWYVTGGEFPEFDGRGNAVGSPVEFERPEGPFTLWAILRDGRGGVAWIEQTIGALP